MKKLIVSLTMALAVTFAIGSEPVANYFKNTYTGMVMSYVAGLGTNSVIEFDYDSHGVPCRLADVTATTNGVATPVIVSRIWAYQREIWVNEVVTNFGEVVTNSYNTGTQIEEITNVLYNSASDSLPVSGHFIDGDVVRVTTGSATGAVVRIAGTAE